MQHAHPASAGEDLDRVKAILYQARLLPRSARRGYLESACTDAADLLPEIESLLEWTGQSRDRSGGALDSTLCDASRQPSRYRPGAVVAGRYRVDRLLGRGGMGEVYAVQDLVLEVPVALKTPRVADAVQRQRLIEEVKLARRVTHPAVCRVYDFGDEGGAPYLTMDLFDGENLEVRIRRLGPIRSLEVAEIGAAVASGLEAAHAAGVLHRDLKPSNVLVAPDGRVRITDFGISSMSGGPADLADFSAPFGCFGTPTYMAPEQIGRTATPSEQSDLYSLGVMLYEMLTGEPPFDALDLELLADQHRESWVEPPSQRVPNVDRDLEDCVLNLLAREPRDRPESAGAAAAELAAIAKRGGELVSRAAPASS